MNFEDCKKIMFQRLNNEITSDELQLWALDHCTKCKERVCHYDECPMFVNNKCKFGE